MTGTRCSPPTWSEEGFAPLGTPPWGDLAIVDKQSAQRFAANFKTPTLVLHGEKDFRVPITQGLAYLQHAATKRRADAPGLLPR